MYRAMTDVARYEDFRRKFKECVESAIVEMELGGMPEETLKLARRWVTFCAVAPVMFARGEEAWKAFAVSHMGKITRGGIEEQILVSCWADCYDPTEVMERMMERAEAGEVDEQTLVREGDLIKALHAQRELQEARLAAYLAARG